MESESRVTVLGFFEPGNGDRMSIDPQEDPGVYAMASQDLRRTSYTDPSQATNPTRQSGVQDAEALVDYTSHAKPLEQIHGSSLHGWGIASGLTVTATIGAPNLQVQPGVAIDSLGQHISLAFGGFAQSTANPDKVGDTTRLPVTKPTGVTIPMPASGGTMYLTIQFLESFDLDSLIGHGVYQMYHSPWLQLVPAAGFVNDGTSLVLAQVTIDNSGRVTSLSAGLRQGVSLPLQRLSVGNYGLQPAGGASIGDDIPEVGALLPRTGGGLTIQADALGIQSTKGNEGIFIDPVGGNVGIGTSSPAYALQVNGAISATDVLQGGNSLVSQIQSLIKSVGDLKQQLVDLAAKATKILKYDTYQVFVRGANNLTPSLSPGTQIIDAPVTGHVTTGNSTGTYGSQVVAAWVTSFASTLVGWSTYRIVRPNGNRVAYEFYPGNTNQGYYLQIHVLYLE